MVRKAEKEKLKAEMEEKNLKKAEKYAALKEKLKKKEVKKMQEEAFKSFFEKNNVPKVNKTGIKESEYVAEAAQSNFIPLPVKKNTRLAPTLRNNPAIAKRRIDSLDMPSGPDGLYLSLLKSDYTPQKQTKTWPYERNVAENNDDKEFFEVESALVNAKLPRAKLLQFHETLRPAYWGTWTKKSQFVSGR